MKSFFVLLALISSLLAQPPAHQIPNRFNMNALQTHVDDNTDDACEFVVLHWFIDLAEAHGVHVVPGPPFENERSLWNFFWENQIVDNVKSYDVVQTAADRFMFSCRFVRWNLRTPDLLERRHVRFRMRCGSQFRPRARLYGRIDGERGVCDRQSPLPAWRSGTDSSSTDESDHDSEEDESEEQVRSRDAERADAVLALLQANLTLRDAASAA